MDVITKKINLYHQWGEHHFHKQQKGFCKQASIQAPSPFQTTLGMNNFYATVTGFARIIPLVTSTEGYRNIYKIHMSLTKIHITFADSLT